MAENPSNDPNRGGDRNAPEPKTDADYNEYGEPKVGARAGRANTIEGYPVPQGVQDIAGMDAYGLASQQGNRMAAEYERTLADAIDSTMARGQEIGNRIQGHYGAIMPGLRGTNAEVSAAYRDALGNLNKGYGALMGDFTGGIGQIANQLAGRLKNYGSLGSVVLPAVQAGLSAPFAAGSRIANVMGQFQNSYQNQLAANLAAAARYGDIAAKGAQLRGAEDASLAQMAAQSQADQLRAQLASGALSLSGMESSMLPALLGLQLQASGMTDPLARMMQFQQAQASQQALQMNPQMAELQRRAFELQNQQAEKQLGK